MAIAVGNVGAVSWTASSGDITPVLPSHSEGDLLLAFNYRRSSGDSQSTSMTTSDGYTSLVERTTSTMKLWGKVAGASESNPTFTHTNTSANNPWGACVIQVTGADTSDLGAIVHASSTRYDSSVTTCTFDGLTITENGVLLIDFAGIIASRTVSETSSPAYTERVDNATTLGNDATIFVQSRVQTSATNTGTHTAELDSTAANSTMTVALLPAASGSVSPQAMSLRRFMGIS